MASTVELFQVWVIETLILHWTVINVNDEYSSFSHTFGKALLDSFNIFAVIAVVSFDFGLSHVEYADVFSFGFKDFTHVGKVCVELFRAKNQWNSLVGCTVGELFL